jgi:hypothetical protein
MKHKLPLVLSLLALLMSLRADDIVANGDFSQGAANWDGDVSSDDSATPNLSSSATSATPAGLTIQLKQDRWTHISQVVQTNADSLKCTVVWRMSSDCSLVTDAAQGNGSVMSKDTFGNLTNYDYGYHMPVKAGDWILMAVKREPGMPKNPWCPIEIPSSKGDPTKQQDATVVFKSLGTYGEKKIVLAFPPGQGSITLLKVAITSLNAPASGPSTAAQ